MKNKRLVLSLSKGFTLIELLVVIAIIGILSSVVLASLNTARNRGSDAAIKADLSGARAAAELYYDSAPNSYGTQAFINTAACGGTGAGVFSDTNMGAQVTDAVSKNGGTVGKCQANNTAYVVAVPLRTAAANAWCIDSDGRSRQIVFATLVAGMDCSLIASSL